MPASEATQILRAVQVGDRSRVDRLAELVYDELRGLARKYLSGRSRAQLQPTELVHEAFLRLVRVENPDWRDRSHFYAVAATAMRQILTDEARTRLRAKRGGGRLHVTLREGDTLSMDADDHVVAVDDALRDLAKSRPERAQLVEMRFFGGMTVADVAQATGRSHRSIEREWTVARAWLRRYLSAASGG